MLTGASLFSGIGAPETAMPEWHWAWSAEIEKFPSAVHALRHPQSVNLGDVTAHDFCERAAAVARPDIIVFGSPCQSFSVAGKRLGLDDPRGNLALVALGIIARLKPRWFVFENVPGLLSSSEGRDFGLFLRTVDELGYSLAWTVLDAQHFGVAQRRERVFAVGHLGDWRGPAAVLFEPEGLCGNHSPREQARQEIASGLGAGSKRSGGRVGRREAAGNKLIAGTLPAAGGTERKHGHGWGQQEWKSGYCIAADLRNGALDDVAQTMQSGGKDGERGLSINSLPHALAFNNTGQGWWDDAATAQAVRKGDNAGGGGARESTLVAFEPRMRGDDGRGYGRGPNFIDDCSPAINTVKPPAIAFGGNNTKGPIDVASAVNTHGRLDFESETFIAQTLRARDGARGVDSDCTDTLIAHSLRADGFDASEDGTGRGTPLIATTLEATAARSRGAGTPIGMIAYGIGSDAVDRSGEGAAGNAAERSGLNIVENCQPSLRARPNNSVATASAVRRLTPRECERLQGYPDDYTAITFRGKPAADGPRYKALGNTMAVPVMRWILSRIEQVHTGATHAHHP